MAVMGMVLSDLENYNSEKILKMILLHDLAESEIGDYIPGEISIEGKRELEDNAFAKILEELPDTIKLQYQKIWKEYLDEKTDESKFVHEIDKLEMALQAKSYEKDGQPKEKLSAFLETAENNITHPKLKELFRKIIEDE
jgi:putative hydrolase of HD superfamily